MWQSQIREYWDYRSIFNSQGNAQNIKQNGTYPKGTHLAENMHQESCLAWNLVAGSWGWGVLQPYSSLCRRCRYFQNGWSKGLECFTSGGVLRGQVQSPHNESEPELTLSPKSGSQHSALILDGKIRTIWQQRTFFSKQLRELPSTLPPSFPSFMTSFGRAKQMFWVQQRPHQHSRLPRTYECDLIQKQGLCRCNQVKMRSYQIQMELQGKEKWFPQVLWLGYKLMCHKTD